MRIFALFGLGGEVGTGGGEGREGDCLLNTAYVFRILLSIRR